MSIFNIDPETFGPKYGYRPDQNPFVNSRQGFNLDADLKRGFKAAVNNNQMRLAMEYMQYMVDILEEKLEQGTTSAPTEEVSETEASTAKSRKTSKANSPQPSDSTPEEGTSE
jgi:hypothetical protein